MATNVTSIKVTEMDHIVLRVADVERSLAFYIGVLGMQGERLEEYRAGAVGFPSVRITSDTLIDIQPGKETLATPDAARNLDHFCMVIEPTDMAALASDLTAKGSHGAGRAGDALGRPRPRGVHLCVGPRRHPARAALLRVGSAGVTTATQPCARWACTNSASFDKPLCYPHWQEWDAGELEECATVVAVLHSGDEALFVYFTGMG